ncbi:API5B-like protein [Mya arenaria]|uniref:API5B-like protein n=1 Tax=Mya arenaria TaxID=6604 RepID=A0ABY7E0D4_MYAAR|nr:API5B-like protein [Mya arenaria]
MVTVEELYQKFGVLADAKDKAGEGGPGEKRLASQFVTRFFKFFPTLAYQAINALFDLCEDDDIMIAEALTQLLQCDDQTELSLIHSSINSLFTMNAKGTLHGVFTQVHGEDDGVREKAIKFLFVLQDVTKEEFIFIMEILKSVPSMNTVIGRSQLLQIKNVHSKGFVLYICNKVLPGLQKLSSSEEGSDEYMPEPPADLETTTSPNEEPKLQFSYVECLMYIFHQLGRKYPEFLTQDEAADRLKDFRIRLQYFARGVQIYIKQLRQDLQGKTGDALKTEESKLKVCALKVTSNINSLIKDLFHNPPAYKQKRYTPITYEGSENGSSHAKKMNRESRQLYSPPSGKFSEKAGTYSGPVEGGDGARGGGSRGGRKL